MKKDRPWAVLFIRSRGLLQLLALSSAEAFTAMPKRDITAGEGEHPINAHTTATRSGLNWCCTAAGKGLSVTPS